MAEKVYSAPVATSSPLSRAQLRLWFLHRLWPDDPAYNLVTAVRIEGPLNSHALAAAATGILREHTGLRSTFTMTNAVPEQQFHRGLPAMAMVDLGALTQDHRGRALSGMLAVLAGTPVDLARGPIAHWTLVREDPTHHALIFTVHHIVFDGGSLAALSSGLSRRYDRFVTGAPWPDPTRDDDAVAARSDPAAPTDTSTARARAFWQNTLASAPSTVEVFAPPPQPQRPPRRPTACTVIFALGSERTSELRRLAAAERCTPFMTLLTIFAGLVSRYTGQQDLVVGTPISTRGPEEPAIGLSLNMLPLRLDVSSSDSTHDGMRRVRDVIIDAADHLSLSFEVMVEMMTPHRDLDRPPIFQVVFAHQMAPPSPTLSGLQTGLLPVDPAAAKYPLSVVVTESADDVELAVTVDSAVADEDAVNLFAANLDLMLSGALARPTQQLRLLPVLGNIDRTASETAPDGFADSAASAPTLPPPRPGEMQVPRPPRTARERQIARLWCTALDTDSVDVARTFFDQGGTSLLLLRLHTAIVAAIAPDLALADLFRYPSVEQLAAHLDSGEPGLDPADADAAVHPTVEAVARGARRRERALERRHD